MKSLIIVESPTKAKTITRFLDKNHMVVSSYGHIRDLPKSKMGIDIEKDFKPSYMVPDKAKKTVAELKKKAKNVDVIYFATDEDREGEAIAWHLEYLLKPGKDKSKRIVFHEITKEAILKALKNPRSIDMNLVDAQQARRILDRLVGYELSPFLWKKVARGLSAGRVQSVAVRLVVEREREIEAFKPEEFWTIDAIFKKENHEFSAQLSKIDNRAVKKFDINKQAKAKEILKNAKENKYSILDIKQKELKKNPLPPFATSTLQQEANRKLGYSVKKIMMVAQQLYEGIDIEKQGSVGLITYMRTDSLSLAEKFLNEAGEYIKNNFGEEYYPKEKRYFKKKQKMAQEAHEAIRPTDIRLDPESIKNNLSNDQYKLYNLIWSRALACQMSQAIFNQTAVEIISRDEKLIFKANGSVIKFDGFLKVYKNATKEEILPELKKDDPLELFKMDSNQHYTQPPGRYTEAGLVKKLEELGIGRPSTYAPTMTTIQNRNYVIKEEKRFKPTDVGILVTDLLVKHFKRIADYEFTAHMEDEFDQIASGKAKWTPIIKDFYMPFKENLTKKEDEVSKKELTEEKTDEICDKCKSEMIIKMGRFGKFLACSNYPDCKNTKPLDENGDKVKEKKIDKKCPKCKKPLVIKFGRYGKFYGCSGYPECKHIENIENKTGVKCTECGKGDIVQKRTKTGRNFYACNKYPDCKFALWQPPTGEKCPECKSLLVYQNKTTIGCSNKECKFTKDNLQE